MISIKEKINERIVPDELPKNAIRIMPESQRL
jgi:hypothetical protein